MYVNVTPKEYFDILQQYVNGRQPDAAIITQLLEAAFTANGGDWDKARAEAGEPTELRVRVK